MLRVQLANNQTLPMVSILAFRILLVSHLVSLLVNLRLNLLYSPPCRQLCNLLGNHHLSHPDAPQFSLLCNHQGSQQLIHLDAPQLCLLHSLLCSPQDRLLCSRLGYRQHCLQLNHRESHRDSHRDNLQVDLLFNHLQTHPSHHHSLLYNHLGSHPHSLREILRINPQEALVCSLLHFRLWNHQYNHFRGRPCNLLLFRQNNRQVSPLVNHLVILLSNLVLIRQILLHNRQDDPQ